MKLIITRFKEIKDGTIGKFELASGNEALMSGYTLEPAGPDTTLRGKDRRIPAGLYQVTWHKSPKFGRLLPLLYSAQVPKDRYILIHAGNYPKDTDGCILLGAMFDENGVYQSKATIERFLKLVKGINFEAEVKNPL